MPHNASQCSTILDIRDTQKVLLPSPGFRLMSVPNFSRIISIHAQGTDLPVKKRQRLEQSAMRNPCKVSGVKRWDAKSHKTTNWDGLRRDQELWQQDGDCLVHLYGQGKSKRGASIKISYASIETATSESFMSTYLGSDTSSPTESLATTPSSSTTHAEYELYIPAPDDALREDAYRWHITTRNFFAYITNKPLVGSKLGKALIDLLERIHLFCPNNATNIQSFLSYVQRQGYSNFVDRSEYALAFLNFAEKFRLRDLWIDAFAHCVGMNDQLDLSPEFDDVSRVTKALITRSYLEMDLHLGRVSRALRTFLEDELAPTNLGLPAPARAHLDRFRSFLHSYYVNKFGYWPPDQGPILDKLLLQSMHQEFRTLYDYLADEGSPLAQSPSRLLTGGICVLQNVDAFNSRHNYEPLPHSLPLLPDYHSLEYRTSSQKGLRSLKLTSKPSKAEQTVTARTALSAATNTLSSVSALVRNYMYFERELTSRPDEKLSVMDARKVRWIAIYSILQILTNAIRAPKEVRGSDAAPYHLCLLTTGTPPWGDSDKEDSLPSPALLARATKTEKKHVSRNDSGDDSAFSIHPDCEGNDYFSHKSTSKRSDTDSSLRPQPLRINTAGAIGRTNSIRGLHKSLASNFSFPLRRNSARSSAMSTNAHSNAPDLPDTLDSADSQASKRLSGYSFAISEEETLDYLYSHDPEHSHLDPNQLYNLPEARTPTLDVFMLDAAASSSSPSTPQSSTSSIFSPISGSNQTWGTATSTSSSDDMDALSWDDRRNSQGIYNMDHESVCGDIHSIYKIGGSHSGSNSPTSSLSTLTASSAAAATAKLLSSHVGLTMQYEAQQQQQQLQMPAWWSVGASDRNSPRGSTTGFNKSQRDITPFTVSVPQDVPEDDVMAFRAYSRESRGGRSGAGSETTLDTFDAMHLLPADY